jgi:hypothetical protein
MNLIDSYYERKVTSYGGDQRLYRFENGYGASLVKGLGSYGLEMAVIKFIHEDDNKEWDIVYDTPITDDVIPHIEDDDEVEYYLSRIKQLSPDGKDTDGVSKKSDTVSVLEMLDSVRKLF